MEHVKAHQTRSEQISVLLDILELKGPEALEKFCVALGHSACGFLADELRRKFTEMTMCTGLEEQGMKLEVTNVVQSNCNFSS
jgi:hypothetical protein